MKILLPLLVVLAWAMPAVAGETAIPHVSVFGTALTLAKPDRLRWYVTVENKGLNLAEVSDAHVQHAAAVLKTIAVLGIRPEDTQTAAMRLAENREYVANSWVKQGYVADTEISFTMSRPEDYRRMWLELARLGGVMVDRVEWDVSNRIEVQNRTRIEALKSARAKAEEMAAALGAKIAEPLETEEVPLDDPWENRNAAFNSSGVVGGPAAGSGEAIAPGSVPIKIRVHVTFHLVTS